MQIGFKLQSNNRDRNQSFFGDSSPMFQKRMLLVFSRSYSFTLDWKGEHRVDKVLFVLI